MAKIQDCLQIKKAKKGKFIAEVLDFFTGQNFMNY